MDDAAKHTVIPEILWLVMTSWLFYGNWACIEMLKSAARSARPKAGLVYSEHLGLTNSCEVSYLGCWQACLKENTATYVTIPQATEKMATQKLGACKFWWMVFTIWQLYVRIVYACCGFNCLWFGLQSLGQSLHTSARHVPLIFHFGACRVTRQRAAALMSLQFAQTVKVEVEKGLSTVFEW